VLALCQYLGILVPRGTDKHPIATFLTVVSVSDHGLQRRKGEDGRRRWPGGGGWGRRLC
jgi:hypothetical protein